MLLAQGRTLGNEELKFQPTMIGSYKLKTEKSLFPGWTTATAIQTEGWLKAYVGGKVYLLCFPLLLFLSFQFAPFSFCFLLSLIPWAYPKSLHGGLDHDCGGKKTGPAARRPGASYQALNRKYVPATLCLTLLTCKMVRIVLPDRIVVERKCYKKLL